MHRVASRNPWDTLSEAVEPQRPLLFQLRTGTSGEAHFAEEYLLASCARFAPEFEGHRRSGLRVLNQASRVRVVRPEITAVAVRPQRRRWGSGAADAGSIGDDGRTGDGYLVQVIRLIEVRESELQIADGAIECDV